MADITAAMVKELRDRTDLGMMDCKKALVESEGDMELAIENLRKSSGMKAAKKAGRIANDGLIGMKMEGDTAAMVEINCETDFAGRDEGFKAFVEQVADQVFSSGVTDVQQMLDDGLESVREALVQKIGENCSIRRADYMQGNVASYVHTNGKIGVLVSLTGGDNELGKDIAMHIAAANPLVVSAEDAPADVVAKEREIYTAQAQESGKPPEIIEKMIDGRIRKYLAEISLYEQAFVKDSDVKVGAMLKKAGASVDRFVRYEVGEGIEKEEVDFAEEVKQQLAN